MSTEEPSPGSTPRRRTSSSSSAPGVSFAAGNGASPTAPPPQILSRKDLRTSRRRRRRSRWYLVGGLVLLIAGTAVGVVLVRNKSHVPSSGSPAGAAPVATPTCPLTGMPSPTGAVPQRPALAVKIGNYPGDRPSAGLNQTDVVFEEPVEGGITRLVAVFHCQSPSLVGDIRSAREPDVGILSQLSNPIFAHVGGIQPVLNLLAGAPLIDKNLTLGGANGQAITIKSGRVAPYSTFANTSNLWALDSSDTSPPAPIFTYSAAPPAGFVPGSGISVHIPFSSSSDVTWQWSVSASQYLRSYSGEPDTLLDGSQTAATNVVIMTVNSFTGPWLENDVGGYEVEVTPTGSGPLVVMRDGVAITGTWTRTNVNQPATFTTAKGTSIDLQPGNTWVELVPRGVTVTPSSALATSSS